MVSLYEIQAKCCEQRHPLRIALVNLARTYGYGQQERSAHNFAKNRLSAWIFQQCSVNSSHDDM